LLALARRRTPAGPRGGAGPADLGLSAVQAQLHPAGLGVGEHVGQGAQPHPRLAGDGKPAGGQQRADLTDGAGDGGTVHPEQRCQGLVRELESQHDQGHQHTVAQGQPVVGAGVGGTAARLAAAAAQRGLVLGGPRVGHLGDEVAEVLLADAGEARMGQGRTDLRWRSHSGMIVRPCSGLPDPFDQPHPSRAKVVTPRRGR
jgi:hypothetical protein